LGPQKENLEKLVLIMRSIFNEKGAAAVEFAIVLPILVMIIFGLIIFGFIFHDFLEITHAAREGVRWASLEEHYDVVYDRAKKSAPGIDWNEVSLDMTDIDGNNISQAMISDQGDPITVTVTYNLPAIVTDLNNSLNAIINLVSGGSSGPLPVTISSSATQRIE